MPTLAFEDWLKKFERIGRGTPAWNAFQCVLDKLTQLKQAPGGKKPEWLTFYDADEDRGWSGDVRPYVLELLYRYTLPPLSYDKKKLKEDAFTRRKLTDLTKETESFVTHLEKTTAWPSNNASEYEVDLSFVLEAYKTAAAYARRALKLLERPYSHEPALSDRYIGFQNVMYECGATERDSLELLRFSLLTHGYKDRELDHLIDRGKIRAGVFRRRKRAAGLRTASFFDLALNGDGKLTPGKSIRIHWTVRKK
jgi:hypothetical protein